MIGHELTAHYGIDHARTLAIILPSAYTKKLEQKKEKLAQYGERVFNITEGSLLERAKAAIQKTEEFFQSLGIKTKLSEYTDDYQPGALPEVLDDHGPNLGPESVGCEAQLHHAQHLPAPGDGAGHFQVIAVKPQPGLAVLQHLKANWSLVKPVAYLSSPSVRGPVTRNRPSG